MNHEAVRTTAIVGLCAVILVLALAITLRATTSLLLRPSVKDMQMIQPTSDGKHTFTYCTRVTEGTSGGLFACGDTTVTYNLGKK